MKISRNNSSFGSNSIRRRRSPLALLPWVLLILVLALLGWFWSRGGPVEQVRVEKPVPADRLGR